MTINITKGQLLNWGREINSLTQSNSILAVFLQSKIKQFFNDNGMRLKGIHSVLNDITKKYYVYEEDIMKMVEGKPVLLDGHTEEEASKEISEFLSQEIPATL